MKNFLRAAILLAASIVHADMPTATTLVAFDQQNLFGFWSPMTDKVRGGDSTIFMRVNEDQTSTIFGELKLNEQNAGFASYRVQREDQKSWNLVDNSNLNITAKADGRSYRILIKDESIFQSPVDYSWQTEVKPTTDLQEISIPLSGLKPVYKGQVLQSAPPLDLSQIKEIGIQINDKKEGPFEFVLKSISAQ